MHPAGFEPAQPWASTKCSTINLSYGCVINMVHDNYGDAGNSTCVGNTTDTNHNVSNNLYTVYNSVDSMSNMVTVGSIRMPRRLYIHSTVLRIIRPAPML